MFITNLVVFPPVKTPIAASGQGEIDYEELRRRAETKKYDDESDHDVQGVYFAWGRGYRSSWLRPGRQRSTENDDERGVPGRFPGRGKHHLRVQRRPGPRRPNRKSPYGHRHQGRHHDPLPSLTWLSAEPEN